MRIIVNNKKKKSDTKCIDIDTNMMYNISSKGGVPNGIS